MWESLARVNAVVGGVVWGPVGLTLLFGTGCLLTVRTGFFQLRYFGYWMRHTIGAIFLDRNVTAHTDDEAISQFQSLCTALAATIGTGNIVGVAAAILAGGPGAVFWMWVMALLGMMTSYAENVLGICYRRRDAAGRWCGGPMYYLAEGLGGGFGRALAVLFACFCVLASFGMGNMSQINSIAGNLQVVFRVPPVATGIVLALLTGRVMLGGLKRVAAVTEAIVPLMALFYLFGALTVVCVHWAAVPAAFAAIFRGAFGLQAAGGGVLGYGMARAISWGFKRGAFSNEAGLGASVLVHCAANVEEPVQQGMWGMFEVFADTMVVCTLTALVVLTSGLVDLDTGAALTGVKGSALVGQAFSTVFGAFGPQFIAVSVLLFAYSTTLGWSHYGTRAVVYLLGERAAAGYKLVFADTMVVCTLTALVVLTSGLVDLDTGAALTGVKGSALVGQAFSTVFGAFGPQFIAVSVLLFAYSTTLGWSHYGTRAVVYLLGERAAAGYKLVFAAMVLVGAVMKLDLAWALSDTFNGLMMLPNLVGVVGLSGVVVRETQAYLKRK